MVFESHNRFIYHPKLYQRTISTWLPVKSPPTLLYPLLSHTSSQGVWWGLGAFTIYCVGEYVYNNFLKETDDHHQHPDTHTPSHH